MRMAFYSLSVGREMREGTQLDRIDGAANRARLPFVEGICAGAGGYLMWCAIGRRLHAVVETPSRWLLKPRLRSRGPRSAARALEQQRDLAAFAAHEINGSVQCLRFALGCGGSGAGNERVARSIARLERSTAQLLQISRLQDRQGGAECVPVDLAPLIASVVDLARPQAERSGLDLRTRLAAGLPPILGEAQALESLAFNLVENGCKYARPGGWIDVELAREAHGLRLVVSDNGPGIEPELLGRLFGRFERGRRVGKPGTGLGLALVKAVAEAHGGSVRVESGANGSRFLVKLPLEGAAWRDSSRQAR